MPITSVDKDLDKLTLTVVADFPVTLQRLWDAYVDPRQIEKFWGPPTWPATFLRHDVAVGGRSVYYMTGPEGEKSAGYWDFVAVDAPNSFEVRDGFGDLDGNPNTELPSMRIEFGFSATDEGARLTTITYFNSLEELEQLLEMGMQEGLTAAMGQIDDVVTDLTSFAAGRGTETQIISDTEVRISRVIRGPVEAVWKANNDPELLKQWLLGPDGWTMPVCEVATEVGQSYRYEWEQEGGEGRFGFTGELLEALPPVRAVTTENMIGMPGPGTTNELTLTAVEAGTVLSLLITYPNKELRDTVLATGMTDGMETSYTRLEQLL